MRNQLVWYLSYGSNLDRERFGYYINGGIPPGSTRSTPYPGCRNPAPPVDYCANELSYQLCFGGKSGTWGNGGIAFVKTDIKDRTLAKGYLIAKEQLEDIISQENGRDPNSRYFKIDSIIGEHHDFEIGLYNRLLLVRYTDDIPVFTITSSKDLLTNMPTIEYLRTIARGLSDTHGMLITDVVEYLITKAGIAGNYDKQTLCESLADMTC